MTTKGYITSEKKLRALLRDKSHVIRCDKVIHEKYHSIYYYDKQLFELKNKESEEETLGVEIEG